MNELLQVLALTTLAGAAIPIGGAIAMFEKISPQWIDEEFRHSLIAFGGRDGFENQTCKILCSGIHITNNPGD